MSVVDGDPPPLWVWLGLGGMKRHDFRSSTLSPVGECESHKWRKYVSICKLIWYGDERRYLYDLIGPSMDV